MPNWQHSAQESGKVDWFVAYGFGTALEPFLGSYTVPLVVCSWLCFQMEKERNRSVRGENKEEKGKEDGRLEVACSD